MNIQLDQVLKNIDAFKNIDEDSLLELTKKFEFVFLEEDVIIFNRGDQADYIYILIEGDLLTYLLDKNNKMHVIGHIKPIKLFGEIGVLSGKSRTLTCKTTSKATLAKLPAKDFNELCNSYPAVMQEILKIIISNSQNTIDYISAEFSLNWHVIISSNKQTDLNEFSKVMQANISANLKTKLICSDDINLILHASDTAAKEYNHLIVVTNSIDILLNKNCFHHIKKIYLLSDSSIHDKIDKRTLDVIKNSKFPLELILLHSDDVKEPINTCHWLNQNDFLLHHHIRKNNSSDYKKTLRFISGKTNALVLGGGGAKGWFHVGLIKALIEKNIEIDIISGVSAGAIIGACYAIDKDIDSITEKLRYLSRIFYQLTQYRNLAWPLISIFKSSKAIDGLQEIFKEKYIEDLWVSFFCISANLSLYKESIHSKGSLVSSLMASNSLPGILPPYIIDKKLHFDGGIINNLPIDIMHNLVGSESTIIASSLTNLSPDKHEYDFPKNVNFLHFIREKIRRTKTKTSYPDMKDIFLQSLLLSASLKEKNNSENATILINPSLSEFSIYQVSEKDELALLNYGYLEAIKALEP
ncbi:NTE family protein RssA [Legionella massiliensis]|uniref:NTE family protein RssA n=1 Tax=Legionella massiliensis TaxID=1034943 RepID=A0A078L5R7_9GAMM|nr:patatin-like phospholipase family protein [Legionella massiliensis]CDZ79288.1 NTE family protein RssA [Legionella massiliensis]CEE15026.1 NTE family protein RssA [Legionella massiliensis]